MNRGIDMTRAQVGAWRVVWRAPQDITGDGIALRWTCRCACGTVREMRGDVLRQGRTLSCGCMSNEDALAHETRVRRNEREEWAWEDAA